MRYYMSYLEAQAVSTFDPTGNWHPKEEETTQPPTSPRNCNYKNLQAVKTAQDENGEEGSEKQKKNLMGNERGKSTEKEKKGVNTQKKRELWQFTSRMPSRSDVENLAPALETKSPVGLRLRGKAKREGEMSCSFGWPQNKDLPSHMCCHG